MSTGLNRQNDTPIGGAAEFRGNMEAGDFIIGDAAIFDGEKFAAGTTDATLKAFGGLTTRLSVGHTADGSFLGNWDDVTPLNSTPVQVTADTVLGTVTVTQAGIYQIDFTANVSSLANNQEYVFTLNLGGVDSTFGSVVTGSNNISSQAVTFSLSGAASASAVVAVTVSNAGNNTFDVVSASFSVFRLG